MLIPIRCISLVLSPRLFFPKHACDLPFCLRCHVLVCGCGFMVGGFIAWLFPYKPAGFVITSRLTRSTLMNERATRVGSNREYTTDYEAALFETLLFFAFWFYALWFMYSDVYCIEISFANISANISRFRSLQHNFWSMEIKSLVGKEWS